MKKVLFMKDHMSLLVIHRVGSKEGQPHNSRESGKVVETWLLLSPSLKVVTNSFVGIYNILCLSIKTIKSSSTFLHALNVFMYTKAILKQKEVGQYVL